MDMQEVLDAFNDLNRRQIAANLAIKALLRTNPEAVHLLDRYLQNLPGPEQLAGLDGQALARDIEGLLPP